MPKKTDKQTQPEAAPAAEREPEQQEGEAKGGSPAQPEVIIIHPGSCTLHLGLASDHTPQSIPHLIAYRRRGGAPPTDPAHRDNSLILRYKTTITAELEAQREREVVKIRQALADSRASVGMGGCEVEEGGYQAFNACAQPVTRESDELALTDLSAEPQFVIGNDALYLPKGADYLVYRPIRCGRLNMEDGQSLACVLSQLEDLWTRAIEEYLDIPKKDFKLCRVILLVSDVVDRSTLTELMNVLLLRMEFSAAVIHQESVCATYSAGLSTSCVVNVGDDVTHICCVEEGMSNPNTRVVLHYGGSDITRLFYSLIRKDSRLDALLVQQLKESACHLDHTIWGAREHPFSVMAPTPGQVFDYEMKMADESIIAPMGVFFPIAFCLPSDEPLMEGQPLLYPHPEDLLDEGHWLGDGVGGGVAKKPNSTGADPGTEGAGPLAEATKRLQAVASGNVFSLDQAVHFSIDCASSPDMKKKLYGSVLLIGGGLAFPGAAAMLQSRLELQLPVAMARGTDPVEVFSNPRDLEPGVVAWRGAAVLKCLDTCRELWVEHQEWEFSGARLLREKAPFQW